MSIRGDPVDLQRLDRDQMLQIQLVRDVKQNAVMMFRDSGGRERRPRRVLLRDLQLRGVLRLRRPASAKHARRNSPR